MIGKYALKNLKLIPIEAAVVPVDDINFAYGFGVYETLKLRAGILYFVEMHVDRLFDSARAIALEHEFTKPAIIKALQDLVRSNAVLDANVKVLLIGGSEASTAQLYAMELNPLYPKRQSYRDGCSVVLYPGERIYPQAKTLNMLVSTLAFKKAQTLHCYDALFENGDGAITEGTRTNLFWIRNKQLHTTPKHRVLSGVTQHTILDCLEAHGVSCIETTLVQDDIPACEGLFLSSTSTKFMPISTVLRLDGSVFCNVEVGPHAHEWVSWYETYLSEYAKTQHPLV